MSGLAGVQNYRYSGQENNLFSILRQHILINVLVAFGGLTGINKYEQLPQDRSRMQLECPADHH